MSTSTTRTRTASLRFRVRQPTAPAVDGPQLPWALVAVGAAVIAAATTWVVCVGIVTLGWLTGPTEEFSDAIMTGSRAWLLLNGVTAVDGPGGGLVPLTLTLAAGWLLASLSGVAVRQRYRGDEVAGDSSAAPRTDLHGSEGSNSIGSLVGVVAVVVGGSYGVLVAAAGLAVGAPVEPRLAGGLVLGLIAAALGAVRVCVVEGYLDPAPPWLVGMPAAVATAVLTPAVVGSGLLAAALIARHGEVASLAGALELSPTASTVLVLGQLAYLPNLVIWSGAYALGAGFGLGDSSIVAPSGVELGLLPGIPVFGALPPEGPGSGWAVAWLAVGGVAGGLAALVRARRNPPAGWASATLLPAAAGLVGGLCWVLLGLVSSGDLGTGRLVGLGPSLPALAVLAPATMALAGALCGLGMALLNRAPNQTG